jgi:hypothetical protein
MSEEELEAATQAYAAVFGEAPPLSRLIPVDVLIPAMAAAVASGHALTREGVLGAAGMKLPDNADGGEDSPPLAMAAQPAPEDPPDLNRAIEGYARRFGTAPPVWGFTHREADLIREIVAATERGEKLTDDELRRRLGESPLPPGAIP